MAALKQPFYIPLPTINPHEYHVRGMTTIDAVGKLDTKALILG